MSATTEPTAVTAGDTVAWVKSLPGYPASDGWALSYALVNAAARQTITSTAVGADHAVTVAASDSASWAAGRYRWQAVVTKGGARHTVGTGDITVAPNLMGSTGGLDTRTPAAKALDAMDAALAEYGSKAYLQSYSIGGRTQSFRSPSEFMAFRSKLKLEVQQQRDAGLIAQGRAPRGKSVQVRFVR